MSSANCIIGNLNYLDNESALTYSSQQTSFPATNAIDLTRRSKVWRGNNYFNIVTGIKAIVFQETSGVNLTANIAVAAYTSDSTLFAAIKTALQAAGSSTYTITRSTTTFKINISSNLSGGGGIFKLMCTNA